MSILSIDSFTAFSSGDVQIALNQFSICGAVKSRGGLASDSICISCKVHQRANGGEKTEDKAVGVSRGGQNTKIHALVDDLGNSVAFRLSKGN